MDCVICHRPAAQKPSVFLNDPWCSDICRKKYKGELSLSQKEIEGLSLDLFKKVEYDADDDLRFLRVDGEDGPSTVQRAEHWRLTIHDASGSVLAEAVVLKEPRGAYLDVKHFPGAVFAEQPTELVYPWTIINGLPALHSHDEGAPGITPEITQAGDEVRWFECVVCKARRSFGPRIGGEDA